MHVALRLHIVRRIGDHQVSSPYARHECLLHIHIHSSSSSSSIGFAASKMLRGQTPSPMVRWQRGGSHVHRNDNTRPTYPSSSPPSPAGACHLTHGKMVGWKNSLALVRVHSLFLSFFLSFRLWRWDVVPPPGVNAQPVLGRQVGVPLIVLGLGALSRRSQCTMYIAGP